MNAQTPNSPPLSPTEWSDPPANKRLVKFSVALVLAFLASAALAGGLTPDTALAVLINLSLALSLPGTQAAVASAQLLVLFLGCMVLFMSFATFASYTRSLSVAVLGAAGIGISTSIFANPVAGVTTALLLLLPLLLLDRLDRVLDYKNLLWLTTLLFLAVLLGSLSWSVYNASGALSVDALRQTLLQACDDYARYYEQMTDMLIAAGMETVVSSMPFYAREGAVSLVLNYRAALLPMIAMVNAFWFVTWYRRANGRQRPRIGLVMEGFALSRTGAVCYLLCSGLSIFGTDLLSLAGTQLMMVLSLPFSIQGINTLRRNMAVYGRGIPFFLLLALVLFAPPVSLLLFLAVCGVFDALMPKTFPSIRPPRQ